MVTVTPAEPQHVRAIADLFEEMDQFYGDAPIGPLTARAQQIADALFGGATTSKVLLAWNGEQLVGMAAYSFLWPAIGVTRSLFLKELYVAQVHRRTGVGKALMDAMFDVAKQHTCSRVEWMTDAINENAQQFYEKLGVPVNRSKLFYRVTLE